MASSRFSISVLLKAIDHLTPVLNRAVGRMQAFGTRLRAVSRRVRAGARSASLMLSAPLIGVAALAIRTAAQYQSSMNMVGAVTNATTQQFEQMGRVARHLGATTQFSASQAADGLKFLGMAGLNVDRSIALLPKTLQLAASAQLDMGTAADISTNVMSAFGLEARDMARVNDVLVNAFTKSNQDLLQLAEGIQKAGPIAKAAGYDVEELAGALGVLAGAGIRGAEAGTGLRNIMLRLPTPNAKATKYLKLLNMELRNQDGSMKKLTGVVEEFEKASLRWSDSIGVIATEQALMETAIEMFGTRGGPQFIAMLGQGSEAMKNMIEGLRETGTAARVADRQMEGLPGALKDLASAWEAVQLAMHKGQDGFVEKQIRGLTEALRSLSEMDPKLMKIVLGIGGVVAVTLPLVVALASLVGGIATLFAFPAIALVTLAIGSIAYAGYTLIKEWKYIKEWWKGIWNEIKAATLADIVKVLGWIQTLIDFIPERVRMRLGIDTEDRKGLEDVIARLNESRYEAWAGRRGTTDWWGQNPDFLAATEQLAEVRVKALMGPMNPKVFIQNLMPPLDAHDPSRFVLGQSKGTDQDPARIVLGQSKGTDQDPARIILGQSKGTDGTKSETEITLRIMADRGLTPLVKQVYRREGDAKVNVATITERGPGLE